MQQLDELQKLRGRQYDEADADETRWEHFSQGLIAGAFGDPGTELDNFYMARSSGGLQLGGASQYQLQSNFESRIKKYDALIRSLIGVLQLQLPEEGVKGVYAPGEQYAFYRDLSSLVITVTKEIFIVDAYLDEQLFNLYVDKVPPSATVRILSSNKIGANVATVARVYVKSRPLELRSSPDVHDRLVFFDQRGWITGQSIKDAARSKPTYLIELEDPSLSALRDIHNRIWTAATSVI